jgi:uncharacterized repeat protein (TIGR01451 family)
MTQTSGTDAFGQTQPAGSVTETATGTIASGSSDTFKLVVSAPASLSNGATFNDTATLSASNPDSNPANNSATVSGSIVNNNADLAVSVSGPASANEGGSVTYTITVTNAGPRSASGVSVADTLASILNYQSATASQGTFGVTNGVVTYSVGTIAAGGKVTLSVTAQAVEDGSPNDSASVSSSSPDPNSANNTASATTSVAEPAITVSGSIQTRSKNLSNFQTATFTHANGVEPASAFTATINWGDGTTSPGTITLSGTTYTVTGSHTYAKSAVHTISTTVTEPVGTGNVRFAVRGGDLSVGLSPRLSTADLTPAPSPALPGGSLVSQILADLTPGPFVTGTGGKNGSGTGAEVHGLDRAALLSLLARREERIGELHPAISAVAEALASLDSADGPLPDQDMNEDSTGQCP